MKSHRKLIVAFAILIALGIVGTAIAVTYYPHTPITDVSITGTLSEGDSVAINSDHTMTCTTSTDTDKYCDDTGWHYPSDPVTHTWSGPGTFDPTTGTSVTWTAPNSTGDKIITVTADDSPLYNETAKTDSITVKVVKVDKLQYNDPVSGYTDISGTLYVHKGTTVTFKAIPDPSGASWPSGKPVWGGTAGASGTGSTKAVNFNTLSTSTSDYKTVTAECGNTVTVNVIVYSFEGIPVPNIIFDGRTYDEYGVEETVFLAHTKYPSGIPSLPLEWKVDSGGVGSVIVSIYDAEAIPGDVDLKLEITSGPSKGRYQLYGKTVVAPTNRYIHAPPPWDGIWHVKDTYTCEFKGDSYLDPKNVSFTNIQRREGTSPPATVKGHFKDDFGTPGPTHPVGNWFTPSDPNINTGCYVVSDTSGTNHSSCATLGDSGTFSWTIDYEYKGDDSVVRNMGTITSYKTMKSNGITRVKKGSVGWFSKNYADPNSSFYTGP